MSLERQLEEGNLAIEEAIMNRKERQLHNHELNELNSSMGVLHFFILERTKYAEDGMARSLEAASSFGPACLRYTNICWSA